MAQFNLGNGYSIDLAQGWTFVHALEDALNQLDEAWVKNGNQIAAPPPGNDGHSHTFSTSMTSDAINKHRDWYYAQVQKLSQMKDNATAILNQYGIVETANTIQWNSTPDSATGTGAGEGKGGGRGAI